MPLPMIVAALAKAGLGLIGNAVLAKGKEVVEEKLGVNLEEAMATPEGRVKLMQVQIEREKELHAFVLAQREQELREQEMSFKDTASARDMNTRINESANASWLAKNIAAVLALMVIAGGGLLLATTREADVRTAVVGLMTLVLGFYFGTSVGSQRKTDELAMIAKGKQ